MILLVRKDQAPSGIDASSMADQSASRLFCLPPELRNKIWSNVLVHPSKTSARHAAPRPNDPQSEWRARFCANLLRTCKHANAECTPILYGENTFAAHPSLLAALPSFLLIVRPNRVSLPPVVIPRVAKMIRRYYIHVRLDTDPRFSRAQVEESFTGVEELEIEVFQAMYGSCDFSVLKLFEGVRGVGKAVVQGSVGDGKYAAWLARCMESPIGTQYPPYTEKWIGGNSAWQAWANGNR